MLLECYFDDSGKESDSSNKFVCIAGYLSPASNWADFNNDWQRTLLRHELHELHMKKWRALKHERGWTDEYADAVLNDFIDVIRKGRLWGFGVGVDARQWTGLPKAKRDIFGSAQEFAMQRIVRLIVDETLAHELVAHINLVFDQDEEFSKPRLTRYFGIKKLDPVAKEKCAIISFADASLCPPLQAADLLAYLTRNRLVERDAGTPESAAWLRLMAPANGVDQKYSWDGWTGPGLESELDEAVATLHAPKA